MNNPQQLLDQASARQLATLFACGDEPLSAAAGAAADRLAAVLNAIDEPPLTALLQHSSARTLADALLSPQTNLATLTAIKDYAKHGRANIGHALHGDAGAALYFLAIAAALVHHGATITTRSAREQQQGFAWAARLVCEPHLAQLLNQAAATTTPAPFDVPIQPITPTEQQHLRPSWLPLLAYVRDLHRRSVHPAQPPLPEPWEDIGPGYCYGPAFGHWDIVHAMLDQVDLAPAHVARQLRNNFANQQPDGYLPGSIWMRREPLPWQSPTEFAKRFNTNAGHPPVWPVAVDAYFARTQDEALLSKALAVAERQIGWFDRERRVGPAYFYSDILNRRWESGADESVRFEDAPREAAIGFDATCHVYLLMDAAARWAQQLGAVDLGLRQRADALAAFVQRELFSPATNFFHDHWAMHDPARRRLCFEGFWPLVVGVATPAQAAALIDQHLLNPREFLTAHPLPSVALTDPAFELRMWRGPVWNSITYWVALGCTRYGRHDAALTLLERALDSSAAVFAHTNAIFEFYHPHAGDPLKCQRKPHTPHNTPCRDYLGHNPLWAMARLYAAAKTKTAAS